MKKLFYYAAVCLVLLVSCDDRVNEKELQCYEAHKKCCDDCFKEYNPVKQEMLTQMDSCWREYARIMDDTTRIPTKAEEAIAREFLKCYRSSSDRMVDADKQLEKCLERCWTELDTCVAKARAGN